MIFGVLFTCCLLILEQFLVFSPFFFVFVKALSSSTTFPAEGLEMFSWGLGSTWPLTLAILLDSAIHGIPLKGFLLRGPSHSTPPFRQWESCMACL